MIRSVNITLRKKLRIARQLTRTLFFQLFCFESIDKFSRTSARRIKIEWIILIESVVYSLVESMKKLAV